MRKAILLCAAATLLCGLAACAQDQPSLSDVARQARLQKQQKGAQLKQVSSKSADSDVQTGTASNDSAGSKPAHVISDENMFEHTAPAAASKPDPDGDKQENSSNAVNQDGRAAEVRSQILSQKSAIDSLKQEIENLSSSIHYAGGNCVANCAQWNERQKQNQDEVDSMKAQLEERKSVWKKCRSRPANKASEALSTSRRTWKSEGKSRCSKSSGFVFLHVLLDV